MRPDVMSAGRQAGHAATPCSARGGALAVLRPWLPFLGIPQCPPGRLHTALCRAPGHIVYRESRLVTTPVCMYIFSEHQTRGHATCRAA